MITTRNIRSALTLTLVLCGSSLLQGQAKVGTTAAPFLGISVSPRAAAMGSAYAAMASDATGMYYNPGGISRSGTSQFVFAHTSWLVNTDLNWFGFVLNLGESALGISVTQLDYGEEMVTTVLEPEGTGERWAARDLAATVSFGRNLTDRFSLGGNVKYIHQKIWNETGSAFAVDLGLLYITPFNDMRIGMSISNFGSDLRMEGKDLIQRVDLDPTATGHNETIVGNLKTDPWPLPLFFRVGVAMDVIRMSRNRLTVAVDAFRPSDNTETLNAGAELAVMDMFFLRAGYKSLFREDSEAGLTMGMGVTMALAGSVQWHLDYTFINYGLFEDIHMLAVAVGF
ncbi:PorV/PorQ family protein [bacterium]|nr:PorV/PorQ family protein [bacterium]